MGDFFPVGIDIGEAEIWVATPRAVQPLKLSTDSWHHNLAQLISSSRPVLVALEPTGRHYSAPVIRVCAAAGAAILQVDHAASRRHRLAMTGPTKTDRHDAAALMDIASLYPQRQVHGTKLLDPAAEDLTTSLRILIQAKRRAITEQTRARNRLRQLAHHIWPSLGDHLDTYLRAVQAHAVTPQQLRDLVDQLAETQRGQHQQPYEDGRARAPLFRLVKSLPDVAAAPHMFGFVIPMLAAEEHAAAEKIATVDRLIETAVSLPPLGELTRLLMTIPRASLDAVAALHAATHCELTRYSADQLKGAVGFHPQRSQSGSHDEAQQAMWGYKPARGALHLWTMTLLSQDAPDNPIREYWLASKAAGHRFAFQAARAKLLRIIAGIARSGQPYSFEAAQLADVREDQRAQAVQP